MLSGQETTRQCDTTGEMGGLSRRRNLETLPLVKAVRLLLAEETGCREINMMGGLCFLIDGNMACGITGEGKLMVRVGKVQYDSMLALPHAAPMDFTGRVLSGFIFVESQGTKTAESIASWVARGVTYAKSLPAK